MDVPRAQQQKPYWHNRKLQISLALAILIPVLSYLIRLQPAGMGVDARNVTVSQVGRGKLLLSVAASGQLLSSNVHSLATQAEGRVEKLQVQSGQTVKVGDVLLTLSNPSLLQLRDESSWMLEQAQAELAALSANLQTEQLNQQATISRAQLAFESAQLQYEAEAKLVAEGIFSKLTHQKSALSTRQLAESLKLEQARLVQNRQNHAAQLAGKQATLERMRKTLQHRQDQVNALTVRAPIAGRVQELNLQIGQMLAANATLAKIAQPGALFAQLQVPELQARDITIGQAAQVDTRNGVLNAQVKAIAPNVSGGVVKVDLQLLQPPPPSARPDLSVEGLIEITHLPDTLQIARPVFSQAESWGSVFKLGKDGIAERVSVQFGPASVSQIAIRKGLAIGDQVVVSDTSSWRNHSRVKIK